MNIVVERLEIIPALAQSVYITSDCTRGPIITCCMDWVSMQSISMRWYHRKKIDSKKIDVSSMKPTL